MDTFIHYAMGATHHAMEDSGLKVTPENAERVAVVIGSGIGGLPLIESQHRRVWEGGPDRFSPFFIPGLIANMTSGQVSIKYGAKGPNLATVHRLRDRRARDRRGVSHDPARRRGRDDRGRRGGGHHAVRRRRVRSMQAMSTRNDEPQRARVRSTRDATASSSARVPASSCSRSWDARRARRAHLRGGGGLRHDGRRLSHDGTRSGGRRGRARHDRRPARRGARTPDGSTTSTPTGRRRPTTTSSRRSRSSASSASTRGRSRSPPRSR